MIPAPRDLVLVVDDDPDIVRFVQVNLEVEGFDVIGARNGSDALRMAIRERPDLAVIDVMMPGVDGLELTRRLRGNPATSAMPIIMLTAKGQTVDKVIGLTAGADDYVLKPFDTMELVARIRSMLRRTKEIRESSPLTGLPGNNRILQEVQTRAANHEAFAVGHIDIDRFKTVNDAYGFARGDEFIAALAECLQNAADAIDTSPRPFIGHIGGDDFVLVCTPDQVKPLTYHAIHAFLAAADAISDPIDAQRGYLQITDRRGNIRRANLVTISIGVSLSTSREFSDPREVLAAASEMKSVAKTQPGSYVAIDRRSVDDGDDRPISPAGSGSIPLPRRGVQPWPDELGENWTAPDWTDEDVDDDWIDALGPDASGANAPELNAPIEPARPSWAVPSRSAPAQAAASPYPPPWADPPAGAGRAQQPPHYGGGYGHGPAVGTAVGSAAGPTTATGRAVVPGPRGDESDEAARWRDHNARDHNARDHNARDHNARDHNARDHNARVDGDRVERDRADRDRGSRDRNESGPLDDAPWVDEPDPAPLPPGWRGF